MYYGCGGSSNEHVLVEENVNEEAISEQYFEKQVEVTYWNGILGQHHVQTQKQEKG